MSKTYIQKTPKKEKTTVSKLQLRLKNSNLCSVIRSGRHMYYKEI